MHPPPHTSPVCDLCQSVRLTLWPCCSADRQEMTSSAVCIGKNKLRILQLFCVCMMKSCPWAPWAALFSNWNERFSSNWRKSCHGWTVGLLQYTPYYNVYTLYIKVHTVLYKYISVHTVPYIQYISIHTVYVNTYTVIMGPTGSSMRGFRLFLGQCTETLFLGQYTETLFLGQCIPRQLLIFLNPRIFEYQIF